MEDYEGNGRLDLVISSMRPDGQLRYYRNNGDGTFTERTKEAGLTGEVGGLNFITAAHTEECPRHAIYCQFAHGEATARSKVTSATMDRARDSPT